MSANPARRALLAITAIGGVLALAVAAVPANAADVDRTASRVADRTRLTAPRVADRADGRVGVACCATAITERPPSAGPSPLQAFAREQWLRAEQVAGGGPASVDRAEARIRAAVLGAGRRTGVLTGVARGAGGRSVAGACVTATGPTGSTTARSRADGRYVLAGLTAGQYALRISNCGSAAGASGSEATTALWPGLPARVALGSGQVKSLPAVTLLPAGGLAAVVRSASPSASRAGTGGISGRVTGNGKPLQGICVAAWRAGGGSGRGAATSRTGRYRITGIQPGRYQVQFTTGCGSSGNWLSQWYPGITTPFPSPKATVIRVRAGKTRTGIDARMKPGGAISGVVRSRSGKRLRGICIEILGRAHGGFEGLGF